jgi:class 3 adenylate cyclase
MHETKYDNMEVVIPFSDFLYPDTTPDAPGHCMYSFYVYPTRALEDDSHSNLPVILTIAVAVAFFLMAVTFYMYNRFVHRRNTKIVGAAAKSNAIVSSLFPSNVRDRLFTENKEGEKQATSQPQNSMNRLKTFMNGEGVPENMEDDVDLAMKSKPIADLFPETTIIFADIVGFTAWSSAREPTQVFTLLETIYRAFDEIAKKRRVFKIETIGDCYVAVTGLPDFRKDHAVAMARFSLDCMQRMQGLVRKLELTLGADTADLDMRIGLHSGPVTAGVIRSERSRFQLFGDTVNTASRMESTGMAGRIQLSQDTADLIIAAGKASWLKPREQKVVAKGKGEMQTYWLNPDDSSGRSETASISNSSITDISMPDYESNLSESDDKDIPHPLEH